jgi:hypothetical protein
MRNQTMRRTLLRCESLEGRDCPAVDVFKVGTTLTVVGDELGNTIEVIENADSTVSVKVDGQEVTSPPSPFSNVRSVVVRGAGGADAITYTAGAAGLVRSVRLQGGAEGDTIKFDGTLLDRAAAPATTQIFVVGGVGADTLEALTGSVAGGDTVLLTVSGGNNADDIKLTAEGTINGTLTTQLNGDAGADTINGTVTVAAASAGTTTVVVRGGLGNDNVIVTANAEADGALNVLVGGGQGADEVSVSVTLLPDTTGSVNVVANGGQGDDTNLSLTLAGQIEGALSATVNGGQGQDTITTSATLAVLEGGRAGVTSLGGLGIDNIVIDISGEIDGTLNLLVGGGAGRDTITGDPVSTASMDLAPGSTGNVTARVNGGLNNDDLTFRVFVGGLPTTANDLNTLLGAADWSFLLNGGPGLLDTAFYSSFATVLNVEDKNPE